MRGGVAGVGANGLLEHLGGFALFALGRVHHRQVVIRLRQPGVVLGERGEYLNGLVVLALLRGNHTLQKTHLHIVGVLLEVVLCPLGGFGEFALLQQLGHFCSRRWLRPCAAHSERQRTNHSCGCNRTSKV